MTSFRSYAICHKITNLIARVCIQKVGGIGAISGGPDVGWGHELAADWRDCADPLL